MGKPLFSLKPLFSPDRFLAGWIEPGRFVFGLDMSYQAFIAKEHGWSPTTGKWLGPVYGDDVYDPEGFPIAWSPGTELMGSGIRFHPIDAIAPVRPVRPVRPVDPHRPLSSPLAATGWSMMSLQEWWQRGWPQPEPAEAPASPDAAAPQSETAAGAADSRT